VIVLKIRCPKGRVGSSPTSGIAENKGFESPHKPPAAFTGRLLLCNLLRSAFLGAPRMILFAASQPGPLGLAVACVVAFCMFGLPILLVIGNLLGINDPLFKSLENKLKSAGSGKPGSTSPRPSGDPITVAAPANAGSGLGKLFGWGVAAVLVAVILYSCASPPPKMSPQEWYYWEHGEGRAIRDEQEYYQDRIPRGR